MHKSYDYENFYFGDFLLSLFNLTVQALSLDKGRQYIRAGIGLSSWKRFKSNDGDDLYNTKSPKNSALYYAAYGYDFTERFSVEGMFQYRHFWY